MMLIEDRQTQNRAEKRALKTETQGEECKKRKNKEKNKKYEISSRRA